MIIYNMLDFELHNFKKEITIEVTLLEAALIKKLRQYNYGEFTIVKMGGNPTRIIRIEDSEILKENDGKSLALDLK